MTMITVLPAAPSRSDSPATFVSKANSFIAALPGLVTEVNVVAGEINAASSVALGSAASAGVSETNAETAAIAAAAVAGVTVYNSGTTYNYPSTVIGSDGNTYRCLGTGIIGDNPVGSVTGNWIFLTIFPSSGFWTPKLWDSSESDSEGQTYASSNPTPTGSYVKIGNMVFFRLKIGLTSLGSLSTSDQVKISLPLLPKYAGSEGFVVGGAVAIASAINLAVAGQAVLWGINHGTTFQVLKPYLILNVFDDLGGTSPLTIGRLTSGSILHISGQYEV